MVELTARKELPSVRDFAGCVSFLPGYSYESPTKDLKLDVVTCHHPNYYQGRVRIATDTEEPNPVIFIAVAAGTVFGFQVLPLRSIGKGLSHTGMTLYLLAREWLRQGLETFGLGSKTAAGYGWFVEVGGATREKRQARNSAATTQAAPTASLTAGEHPLIREWRGKTQPGNFRAFRPLPAALKDDNELKHVFEAIMPSIELTKLKRSNSYWQSFVSHADGAAILKRLKIDLR